jgi:integrase
MLQDKDVRRWFDNVARGSPVTADVYLRRLAAFCSTQHTTPKGLATKSERELHCLLLDCVSQMEKNGNAGSYIESTVKAVKSWLGHNGKIVRRKIKIRGARDTPSLKDERVPTREELRRILLSGDKKARAACILVAHSGLRIEVLGNYAGTDGLTVRDLPELEVEGESIAFPKVPTLLTVRRELSKAGHQYFTFLSQEACEYVKDYLEDRIREGETLTLDSPLITPKLRMKPFIRANNIGDAIREAIRKAGFRWRSYVLRSYFDTQLMLAESKGLVLRDYRQFWMGHKGDIENRYTTNKHKLPESVIEDMREAYGRSQEYLQTSKTVETSEEKLAQAFRKQLLLVAGFKQDEVEKMELSAINDGQLQDIVRKRLLGTSTDDCPKQKAVNIDEVDGYLTQGWEYVATLPNKKVVIKLNT